jgi:hypothetical protein
MCRLIIATMTMRQSNSEEAAAGATYASEQCSTKFETCYTHLDKKMRGSHRAFKHRKYFHC